MMLYRSDRPSTDLSSHTKEIRALSDNRTPEQRATALYWNFATGTWRGGCTVGDRSRGSPRVEVTVDLTFDGTDDRPHDRSPVPSSSACSVKYPVPLIAC
jgi:hypothetical protein